jgi:hypothetical protein
MPGRKPDYRLVFVQDNGKGRKTSFRIGAGWINESKDTGDKSVGIEVNIGLPLVLQPNTKLVLFENKEVQEDAEFDTVT